MGRAGPGASPYAFGVSEARMLLRTRSMASVQGQPPPGAMRQLQDRTPELQTDILDINYLF